MNTHTRDKIIELLDTTCDVIKGCRDEATGMKVVMMLAMIKGMVIATPPEEKTNTNHEQH
jgi:hypothetical protein